MENNNEKSSKENKLNFKDNFKKDNLNKKAALLSCSSLLLLILPIIFTSIADLLQNNLVEKIILTLSLFSAFGSIGLMALIRIRYPKNIFGILLMISFILIMIFGTIFLVIEAKNCTCNYCENEIRNCPG